MGEKLRVPIVKEAKPGSLTDFSLDNFKKSFKNSDIGYATKWWGNRWNDGKNFANRGKEFVKDLAANYDFINKERKALEAGETSPGLTKAVENNQPLIRHVGENFGDSAATGAKNNVLKTVDEFKGHFKNNAGKYLGGGAALLGGGGLLLNSIFGNGGGGDVGPNTNQLAGGFTQPNSALANIFGVTPSTPGSFSKYGSVKTAGLLGTLGIASLVKDQFIDTIEPRKKESPLTKAQLQEMLGLRPEGEPSLELNLPAGHPLSNNQRTKAQLLQMVDKANRDALAKYEHGLKR